MRRLIIVTIPVLIISCMPRYIAKSYKGKPWYVQTIPGKMECEFFDKGGEGIAYHDSDKINNGSGKLNLANGSFLNEFRMHEGVDISYTKPGNIDNNPFNKSEPEMNQLYVGWTKPGEWINYTIKVKRSVMYRIGLKYTANGDGEIGLNIDDLEIAAAIKITSTHNDADTVTWRQWHHWNSIDSLTSIRLKKGWHLPKYTEDLCWNIACSIYLNHSITF